MTTHDPKSHADTPERRMLTRTKIVATVGPASESPEVLAKLIEAGVSVFRLNFSHGSLADHARRLTVIRETARASGRPVAVLGDLCGPKIRLGPVPAGIVLAPGEEVILRGDGESLPPSIDAAPTPPATERRAAAREPRKQFVVTYPGFSKDVHPGNRVLIADGAVRMLATESVTNDHGAPCGVRCTVRIGGPVSTGKGVNLPDSRLKVPAITEKDWQDVSWAVEHDLDFLALSFVRRSEEIFQLRERLIELSRGARPPIPIIAKIEKPQAVASLEEIVDASDAIMVARGDLGVEMDIAQVPVVQKRILASAQTWGKPCIVATQMLETMIESATPTRAEASDVANAVFDSADAVMLSGETAVGKHPTLVVETMHRIIEAAETNVQELPAVDSAPKRLVESRYRTAALAHGAWHVARDIGARLVVCWSQQGGTARYLSQNNFRVPIVAYSSDERAARQMALLANVTPIFAQPPASGLLRDWTDMVERDFLARGWGKVGEPVILLAGKPLGAAKATNSIAILHLGDPTGGYRSHRS